MKKVNKDPFSNGTDFMIWEEHNCNKCIKSSEPRISEEDGLTYYTNKREDGLPKCSIQRDIVTRMFLNEPIKEETVKICEEFIQDGVLCPYMQTEYPKKKHTTKSPKQDIDLIAKLQEQCDRIEAEYKQHLARKKSAYAKKKQTKTK